VDKAHHHIEFMAQSLRTFEVFNIQRAVDTAQDIVDAIRAGDGERASRAMSVHLNIVNFELEKEFLPPPGTRKRG
jgi:DNA-binding GntR family transcriptional regulator